MEAELRRKEEVEKAKAKLKDTKQVIEETMNRIQKLEADFKEDKQQYCKKLKNLQNVQATQTIRLSKLTNELKNLEAVLQTRKTEENGLLEVVGEIKEELRKVKDEAETMVSNFRKKIEELENDIQIAWAQFESDREAEVLLELGLSSLKTEEQIPIIEEMFKKRKQVMMKRQEELEKEINLIEEVQRHVEKEIKCKSQELSLLRDKHSSLTKVYEMTKKEKDSH